MSLWWKLEEVRLAVSLSIRYWTLQAASSWSSVYICSIWFENRLQCQTYFFMCFFGLAWIWYYLNYFEKNWPHQRTEKFVRMLEIEVPLYFCELSIASSWFSEISDKQNIYRKFYFIFILLCLISEWDNFIAVSINAGVCVHPPFQIDFFQLVNCS